MYPNTHSTAKRTGFLAIALTALVLGFSIAVGLGTFAYHSYNDATATLFPHLLLTGSLFLALICMLAFLAGFVSLGRRRLSGPERIAWVLLMIIFPVLGTVIFFLVSPGNQSIEGA